MIFIVGNSRSGTTLMGRILNESDEIFTFHELHFFEELYSDKQTELGDTASIELFANLMSRQRQGYLNPNRSHLEFIEESKEAIGKKLTSPLTPYQVFEAYLKYDAKLNGKEVPCEQTPRNLFSVEDILDNAPESRIINMIRDPRDVLLSQKLKRKRRKLGADIPRKEAIRAWANYHPIVISKLWKSSYREAQKYKVTEQFKSIQFESLIINTSEVLTEICQFLGIKDDPSLANVEQKGSSLNMDKKGKKGLNRKMIGTYKNGMLSASEIWLCQYLNRKEMITLGYEQEKFAFPPIGICIYLVTLPFKIFLALVLNLNRSKNLIKSIRKRL